MTFGFRRAEILSAQINGATLLALGRRSSSSRASAGCSTRRTSTATPVLLVALAGHRGQPRRDGVLARADRGSLNVEGAYQHILTDLFAFVATAIAGAVVIVTGFTRADGIAALLVAALMLRAAYGLLVASGRVVPRGGARGPRPGRDRPRAGRRARRGRGPRPARLGGHLRASRRCRRTCSSARDTDCHAARRELQVAACSERFGIEHTTLQTDHEGGELLEISTAQLRP